MPKRKLDSEIDSEKKKKYEVTEEEVEMANRMYPDLFSGNYVFDDIDCNMGYTCSGDIFDNSIISSEMEQEL